MSFIKIRKYYKGKSRKLLLVIMVASLSLISCIDKKVETMETSKNEKLIKLYFEYFNNHEWEKMASLYSEKAEFKDPSLGEGIIKQSRQEIITKYSDLAKTFPDLQDKVIQIYPSGEKYIIVEFVSNGTAPDNSKFELPICTIFTIENGIIVKDFSYFDNFDEEKK